MSRRYSWLRILFPALLLPALLPADEVQLWYSETPAWNAAPGGFGGTMRTAPAMGEKAPEMLANWVIAVPKTGITYRLQATWAPVAGGASNAVYRVYDGDRAVASFTVNQRVEPVGEMVKKTAFQDLGPITPLNPTLRVVLSNRANGTVVADTVRLKPPQ